MFGGLRSIQWIGRYPIKRSDPSKPWVQDAFGINHVMAFEFDVKEFEFVILSRLIAGCGRAVDQQLRRNQHAIDQQGVSPRHVEIGMRTLDARAERVMRTGSASLTHGFDGSLFLKG